MALHEITIEVWGSTPFPLDMLRYDTCVPCSQDDVSKIDHSIRRSEFRKISADDAIRLRMFSASRKSQPTTGRWNSFGWGVRVVR